MKGFIYKITGKNGKNYIGMTTQKPEQRLKQHKRSLRMWLENIPQCRSAYAMRDGFKFEILEERKIKTRKELHQLETSYIKSFECVNVGSSSNKLRILLRSGRLI